VGGYFPFPAKRYEASPPQTFDFWRFPAAVKGPNFDISAFGSILAEQNNGRLKTDKPDRLTNLGTLNFEAETVHCLSLAR